MKMYLFFQLLHMYWTLIGSELVLEGINSALAKKKIP